MDFDLLLEGLADLFKLYKWNSKLNQSWLSCFYLSEENYNELIFSPSVYSLHGSLIDWTIYLQS